MIWSFLGSSEDKAKLLALQKALRSLSLLFDYPSLIGADHPEEVLNQLSSILMGASQKDPVVSVVVTNKACVQLSFCGYTVKCTSQSSKKAARNYLSARILGLLGIKTGQTNRIPTSLSFLKVIKKIIQLFECCSLIHADAHDTTLKNRLEVWFTKNNLPNPVFEDTEEVIGAKATFSVQITSCSPG